MLQREIKDKNHGFNLVARVFLAEGARRFWLVLRVRVFQAGRLLVPSHENKPKISYGLLLQNFC